MIMVSYYRLKETRRETNAHCAMKKRAGVHNPSPLYVPGIQVPEQGARVGGINVAMLSALSKPTLKLL